MSQDNGLILRKNKSGKFVLQGYSAISSHFAIADAYPLVEDAPEECIHDTLEAAITKCEEMESDWPSEYGLTIKLT